jgi:lipopolysaccharide/colanic/teichoic acid biosynthesis glycosyltransferase
MSSLLTGAYSIDVLRHPNAGIARASISLMLAFALLFAITYFLKVESRFSRIITGTSFIIALAAIGLAREVAGHLIRRALRGKFTTEIVLADGAAVPPSEDYLVLDAEQLGLHPDTKDAAMLIRLASVVQGADRIVISCARGAALKWAPMLKGANVQGEILLPEYDQIAPIGVAKLHGRTTLVVSAGPLNLREQLVKRAFDLAVAIPALLLLLPVFAVIAICIKFDSRGPVFFRQRRLGHGNTLFEIFKFRTMAVENTDADGTVSASPDDCRVTRVGRFLRRTSLDELPQFINVLLGSMSIVGPRPHALGSLAGDELFWHVDERYWYRHALKPGITGLAQVRGFRGATQCREDLTSRLQADLEYMSGWSLWTDIAITARTLRIVAHPRAF